MGSGFKDWAAGDVLTAADVDGYLMRQTVMTFADASARDTALSGVLDEGMVAYLEDVNALTVYNGSAWVAVIDSDVLTVDTANNRVGINDSTPSYALDVTGDINATGALRIGGVAQGAYTDYSASQTFTNLTLGNGTVESFYTQVNDLVHFYGRVVWGSTTSLSGAWRINLPVNSTEGAATVNLFHGVGSLEDTGTTGRVGFFISYSNNALGIISLNGTTGQTATVNATTPHTWAATDRMTWNIVYKAA